MKKTIHILILVLISNYTFSQTEKESYWNQFIESDRIEIGLEHYNNITFEKAYRIWTDIQVVELIKINDSTYCGLIVNFAYKSNQDEIKEKRVFQKMKISDKTVQLLIEKLNSENIEKLRDCDEIEGYAYGEDGNTYIFEIGTLKQRRVYSYWEPENELYQNPNIKEVQNVRNILVAIKKEINLSDSYKKFYNQLPKGTYISGMIIYTIE